MLKKTETDEGLSFIVIIFIIGGILIGEGALALPPPFGYVYDEVGSQKPRYRNFYSSTACKTSIGFTAGQGYSFAKTFLSKIFFADL